MAMEPGYSVPGLTSIIVPVLALRRKWTIHHRFSRPRSLPDLLADIAAAQGCNCETIVVCNGTDDALRQFVSKSPLVSKYVLNSTNPGVSRAWNIGAMMAEGEYLCFVNDDVEVAPRTLIELRRHLQYDPSFGQVGPAGGRYDRGGPGPRVGLDSIEEADEISGYLFMTRRHVYDLVGGFDIRFTPAGFEEIDYSFKLRAAGFKCAVIPNTGAVHHDAGGVSRSGPPIRYFGRDVSRGELHRRNRSLFQTKWAPRCN